MAVERVAKVVVIHGVHQVIVMLHLELMVAVPVQLIQDPAAVVEAVLVEAVVHHMETGVLELQAAQV